MTTSSRAGARVAVAALLLACSAPLAAQSLKSSFDRTKIPPASTVPELRVPTWTNTRLSDGAQLIVSERRNLPLVSFTITPRPGHTLTALEAAADSIVTRLKREGPTADELQRAKAGQQLDFVRGLESNLGKVFQLATSQVFHGDPGYYRIDYQRTQAVTAADIKRVANRYLTGGRVVLSVVPQGQKSEAAQAERSVPVSLGGVQ